MVRTLERESVASCSRLCYRCNETGVPVLLNDCHRCIVGKVSFGSWPKMENSFVLLTDVSFPRDADNISALMEDVVAVIEPL